ncbi:MAG TPA: dihydroorotate dehydrogenase-like protein, partial [Anaerolineae bacterium]|nr:dihydroorotate dehydrogenase-like protein [Anaerolineae bacterium]
VRLDQAGADGLVLFNRFYQPDFDLDTEKVIPTLELSTSPELRLRLRWIAIISQFVEAELAITGGVHTAVDILKGIMAGAAVVMMTSALLNHGIDYLAQVLADLETLMKRDDFDSIAAVRGRMSQQRVAEPSVFERANYMNIILSMME